MNSTLKKIIKAVIPAAWIRELRNTYYKTLESLTPAERAMAKRIRRVSRARTPDDVRRIAKQMGYTYFLDYDDQITTKLREFRSAVDYLEVDLRDKTVLDVGPGTADSLDGARDMGAASTLFVDEEPFFCRFAELKGHHGWKHNYFFKPYFPEALFGTVDFIYTKGSINCVWVNDQDRLLEFAQPGGFFRFGEWLEALIQLLKPGGEIMLVPAMAKQEQCLVDQEYDIDTYYWCPDIEAYRSGHFVRTLVAMGFSLHDNIPGFTHPQAFPLAFHYRNR